ncbi:TIGR02265 family protein [Archangium lansingense]|uniref:TIGR02265 family protein n=1 Tax=Archangium lansingense TaxID=2995310 RepID=A0ABT4AMZ3_9BACT|nr:TIGR02265 family protein [Archangium lansinium]MCY1083045.1 TIGR02265 family protein [Archangium lansinium]
MCNQAMAPADAPSDWERDLVWRTSQARPEDTARGVFFKGALEAVRELGDASAVRSCQEALGEERFVDAFRYPIHSLLRTLSCAARQLAPGHGGGEAVLRELGRRANANYLASPLGRTVKMMTQGSPRRLMENAANIHRQTMSFGVLRVEWTGPSSGRVLRRGDFWPAAWQEGALEYLLCATGGQRVRVEREWVDGLDGGFAFAWG